MTSDEENIAVNSRLDEALRRVCASDLGLVDSRFLCSSLGSLNPTDPICVSETTTLEAVLALFRDRKVGCVLVVDKCNLLVGIFSERDWVLKIASGDDALDTMIVKDYMTSDPVTQPIDGTVAFALNLMAQGGFRHLPLIDRDGHPVGVVSVKDIVDYIVSTSLDALLQFDTEVV